MIRGFFDVDFPTPLPKAWIGVALPEIAPDWTPVDFVIDSGASVTCLHPADARGRLGLTMERYRELEQVAPPDRSISGISGLVEYFVVPAQYLLVHEDGAVRRIDAHIRTAPPRPGDERIPSLIGWDILQHFRIVLDRRTGEVELQ